MSHYEFLRRVGIDGNLFTIYEPSYADDGSFGVLIEDSEGWHTDIIWFDKDGNYLER